MGICFSDHEMSSEHSWCLREDKSLLQNPSSMGNILTGDNDLPVQMCGLWLKTRVKLNWSPFLCQAHWAFLATISSVWGYFPSSSLGLKLDYSLILVACQADPWNTDGIFQAQSCWDLWHDFNQCWKILLGFFIMVPQVIFARISPLFHL